MEAKCILIKISVTACTNVSILFHKQKLPHCHLLMEYASRAREYMKMGITCCSKKFFLSQV